MWKVSLILLGCALAVALACRDESSPRAEIVCYYDGFLQATLIDPCKCTLLVISKVKVNGYFKLVSDLDFAEINALKKKNPDLKAIVSVGGYQVKPEVFVSALSSVEGIANFTEGISTFVSAHSLDGVEINWRWPGTPGGLKNKDDLTTLMRAIKLSLDDHSHNVTRRQIESETAEEGDPFSLLDIFEDPEEVTKYVSLETTEDYLSDSTTSTASDQFSTSTSTSKTSEISAEKVSTTTEEFATLSYDVAEEMDPSYAVGPDYLLLDDYFMNSESPDREGEDNEKGQSKINKDDEGTQEQEEKTQIRKQGERTAGRGAIKFKDHFKTSEGTTLEDIAKQQGAKGGWKIARRRVIGPAERLIRPLEKRIGSSKILILTVSARPEHIVKGYDLKALSNIVDMFIVPSDNLTANSITSRQNGSIITYHHSRLMGVSDIQNADSLIDLIVSMGVPLDRLILSVPTVGALFTLTNVTENTPRSPASGPPSWIPYRKVCSLLGDGNWTLERDEDLTGPYAYKGDQWMSFDDPISLRVKSKYALLRGLAGIGIKVVDDEDWTGVCSQGAFPLATSIFETFTQLARTPRKAVLRGLVRDLETADSTIRTTVEGSSTDLRISPFRIVRVVDKTGAIKAIRSNGDTKHKCTRQGYYRDSDNCSQFYRCVKFNQYIDDYTIFEYSCPEGLVFDDRWEICAWPSTASPCDGSSEIFPVPKNKNICNQEGYFTDPENCRWFYACKDYYGNKTFTHYEFRCPFGLAYDEENHICNWPWLVPSCGESEPVMEARGQGKAIKSGRTELQFESEQTVKECVNCNEAEIKIRGKGIYHPEKGIIVPTTYFDQVSALESVKLSADDEEQKRRQSSTSNKKNKHATTLQNIKTNKVAIGKTFDRENINSEVPLEVGFNFKTDNLNENGRDKSQINDQNFKIENSPKTSFNTERNHAIFVSKDRATKHSFDGNKDHSIGEHRSKSEISRLTPSIHDLSIASNNPKAKDHFQANENAERKSISGNNSPTTHSRFDSEVRENAGTIRFRQFDLPTDHHRSPQGAKDNEYNSPVAIHFSTAGSPGRSHRHGVDNNTPRLIVTENNHQSQTLFNDAISSTHLGHSKLGHNLDQIQNFQSNPLPTRKSISNANVQATNDKRKGSSHSSAVLQQSSIDSQSEHSSQAIFTPSIGSSIISSFNHDDKSFDNRHKSYSHDIGNVASRGKQQVRDSHFEIKGQGENFNSPVSKVKFNGDVEFGGHFNDGAKFKTENKEISVPSSRVTASAQENISKTNFGGNYKAHNGEVTLFNENSKLRSNVHGGDSDVVAQSFSKSIGDNISTQIDGRKKQATINRNPLDGSLKQNTQHNIHGKTIFDNRSVLTGTSLNSEKDIKNKYESNSRPRIQSGTKETLKSENRSKPEGALEHRGALHYERNERVQERVLGTSLKSAEKSTTLSDNNHQNRKFNHINGKSESLLPGKVPTIISKSSRPFDYATVEHKNKQKFPSQGPIGISELGVAQGKTEKLHLNGNVEYAKNSEPENIFNSRKSYQESSSLGGHKSISDISGSAPQGFTVNKGIGRSRVTKGHYRSGVNKGAVIKETHGIDLEFKDGGILKHVPDNGHVNNEDGIISGEKTKIEQGSILKQGINLSQVNNAGRMQHDSNLKQIGNLNVNNEKSSGFAHASDDSNNYGHGESSGFVNGKDRNKNFRHEERPGFGHAGDINKNFGHGGSSGFVHANDGNKNIGHRGSLGFSHGSESDKNLGLGGSSGYVEGNDGNKNFDNRGSLGFGHTNDGNKSFNHRGSSGFGHAREGSNNFGHGGDSGFSLPSDESKSLGHGGSSGLDYASEGNKNVVRGGNSGFGHASESSKNFGPRRNSGFSHPSDGNKKIGLGESSEFVHAGNGKHFGHKGGSEFVHASEGDKIFSREGGSEFVHASSDDSSNFGHGGSSGLRNTSEVHKSIPKQLKNLENVNTLKQTDTVYQDASLRNSGSLTQQRNVVKVQGNQKNSYERGFVSGHKSNFGQGSISGQRDTAKFGDDFVSGVSVPFGSKGNDGRDAQGGRVGQENENISLHNFRKKINIATEDSVREESSSGQRGSFEIKQNNKQRSQVTNYSAQKQEKEQRYILGAGADLRQKSNLGQSDEKVKVTRNEHVDISEKVGFTKDEISVKPKHNDDFKTTQFPNSYNKNIGGSLLSGSSSKSARNIADNGRFNLEEKSGVLKHSQTNLKGSSRIEGQSPKGNMQFSGSLRPMVDGFKSAVKGGNRVNQEHDRVATEHEENYKPGYGGIPNIGGINASSNHRHLPQEKSNSAQNYKLVKPESPSHNENNYKPTGINAVQLNKNKSTNKNLEGTIANPQLFNQVLGKSINPNANPSGPFSSNNNLNVFSVRKPVNSGPSLLAKLGNKPKFQRFGPGGFRDFDDNLGPEVCERAGLFRHPKSCDKFYECYWDRWIEKFTLHIFDCPVTIVYDSAITACNWPFNGPPCTED